MLKPRLTGEIVGVLVIISLLFYSKCEGRRSGILEEREKTAIAEAKQHKKSAQALLDTALSVKRVSDSLKAEIAQADRRIEGHRLVARGAIKDYRRLRDSVVANEPDSVDLKIIEAADHSLENLEAEVRALYVKTGIQDSVITKQDRIIALQASALSERDSQIKSLNQRIALNVKRRSSARREGWIQGGSAVAFLVVVNQARK